MYLRAYALADPTQKVARTETYQKPRNEVGQSDSHSWELESENTEKIRLEMELKPMQ